MAREWPFAAAEGRIRTPRQVMSEGFNQVLTLAGLLALAALLLVPVGMLLKQSLTGPDGFTLSNYARIFSDRRLWAAVRNTAIIAPLSALFAVFVSVPLAWIVARTDVPGKRWIRALIMASFITPPVLTAFAWIMLASERTGWINVYWRQLTGSREALFNIYSFEGLIFVMALTTFPYVFTMVVNTLEKMNPEFEDAASILGASPRQIFWGVTLPLALPAITAGLLLAGLHAMTVVAVPAIIAITGGFHTISTQILILFQWPARPELAAAISMVLAVMAAILYWVRMRVLGRRGFAIVTGKAVQSRLIHLGWGRVPALAFCLAVVGLALVLPYLMIGRAAFSLAWSRPFGGANFTLDNFRQVLMVSATTQQAITNSIWYGAAAATAAAIVAAITAYLHNRRLVVGHQALGVLPLIPLIVPNIVMAVGIFFAFSGPPLPLYGTPWILIIGYAIIGLPLAFFQMDVTVRTIHPELEEAAWIAGAPRWRTLVDILVPLVRSGLAAAWCLAFIQSMRELGVSLMLFTGRTRVIPATIYDLYEMGSHEQLAALGVVLLVLVFVIAWIGQRLGGSPEAARRVE